VAVWLCREGIPAEGQAVKTKVSRAEKAELSEAGSGRGASMGDNRSDNERAVAYGSRNACFQTRDAKGMPEKTGWWPGMRGRDRQTSSGKWSDSRRAESTREDKIRERQERDTRAWSRRLGWVPERALNVGVA
jgi:hypothetical protein